MRIILASSNPGKLRELSALLTPLGYEVSPQATSGIATPPETGATFAENALLKARYAAGAAGLPALADDSGLEVDALNGRPGIHSARYAGIAPGDRENLEKLLLELRGVPPARRGARYQCVIAFVRDAGDREPLIARGTWEGEIAEAPRGSGGFGYDPVFLPAGLATTAAADAAAKNARSHRGQALRSLAAQLQRDRTGL